MYKMDKDVYNKLLGENITKSYKKADEQHLHEINSECSQISTELNIAYRIEITAEKQAYITLKDHKDNFVNRPTCRLINPTKSNLGRVSQKILQSINKTVRDKMKLNQWQNTGEVIDWFNALSNKCSTSFVIIISLIPIFGILVKIQ